MQFSMASASRRVHSRSLAAVLHRRLSTSCRATTTIPTAALHSSGPASLLPLHAARDVSALTAARRWQSAGAWGGAGDGTDGFAADDSTGLQSELVRELEGEGNLSLDAALSQPLVKADLHSPSARIRLEKIERPPGRFDLLTNSLVYRWQTTAGEARKVTGPMREWASELKYRTGVHIEAEPTNPGRLVAASDDGGYSNADEVEVTIYLFGSERGIFNCRQLMESALDEEPAYVRLGVFRRRPAKPSAAATANPNEDVEWLMLRRINRDLRPPDIPPISLKLPGKWTLLFEQYKEAAIRSLWEETGITVDPTAVFPTGRLHQSNPAYYWRVPVHYFVAEVPYDVEVLGPQVGVNAYMHHWEVGLLRQSPDPIDRAWAQLANPETGCAWMTAPMIDELQRPLRGENYMRTRYTPPPYSNLNSVLGFELPESEAANASGDAVEQSDVASDDAPVSAETPVDAAEAPASAPAAQEPKPSE